MNAKQKKRAWILFFVVLSLAAATTLVLYGLRQNINLFYSPTQVTAHEAPVGKTIRLGGMVKTGSFKRDDKTLDVEFILTDFQQEVLVKYNGILPDLFREGQGIVTNGQLSPAGYFQAQEVLAKHDSNYMPPEVKATLKKQVIS